MKRTIALAALILLAIAVPASADAATDSKDSCKQGGFAQYVDPDTAAPFANQGACVSFVAEGGTLVPVRQPAIIITDPATEHPGHPDVYSIGFDLTGFQPNTYVRTLVYFANDGIQDLSLTTDTNGNAVGYVITNYCDVRPYFSGQVLRITAEAGDDYAEVVPEIVQCP